VVFSKTIDGTRRSFEFDDSLILIYQLYKRRIGAPVATVPIERSCIVLQRQHDLVGAETEQQR
jgi:hypothetical protein